MITLAATLFILIGVACAAIAFTSGVLLVLQWREHMLKRANGDGLTA